MCQNIYHIVAYITKHGRVGWHWGMAGKLPLRCRLDTCQLHFQSIVLLMCLRKHIRRRPGAVPLGPRWRQKKLLASAGPSRSCSSHLGSDPADASFSHCL